jgi:hypothetical protein
LPEKVIVSSVALFQLTVDDESVRDALLVDFGADFKLESKVSSVIRGYFSLKNLGSIIYLRQTQWKCVLSFDNSTVMFP